MFGAASTTEPENVVLHNFRTELHLRALKRRCLVLAALLHKLCDTLLLGPFSVQVSCLDALFY